MNNKTTLLATSLLSLTTLIGCGSTGNGTLLGAGIGALAGQAIGCDTEATLIGAGAGALGGWIIGSEVEKEELRQRREIAEMVAQQDRYEMNNGVTMRRSETRKVLNRDGTYTIVGEETTVSEKEESGYTGLPNN